MAASRTKILLSTWGVLRSYDSLIISLFCIFDKALLTIAISVVTIFYETSHVHGYDIDLSELFMLNVKGVSTEIAVVKHCLK